jgi:hypothetical protein
MFSCLSVCICWLPFCWVSGFLNYLLSVVCLPVFLISQLIYAILLFCYICSAVCLSVYLSTQLISVFLSSCLSVCLSVCVCWLSAHCMSICPHTCLSIKVYVSGQAHKYFRLVDSRGKKVDSRHKHKQTRGRLTPTGIDRETQWHYYVIEGKNLSKSKRHKRAKGSGKLGFSLDVVFWNDDIWRHRCSELRGWVHTASCPILIHRPPQTHRTSSEIRGRQDDASPSHLG